MNILLLTHSIPFPPDNGPKVKAYHLLRYLSERHQVTLVSFTRGIEDETNAAALRPLCAALYTVRLNSTRTNDYIALLISMLSNVPFAIERDSSSDMHVLLARLVAEASERGEPFDLVHADQFHMSPYAEPLPLPRLLDQHNAVYKIYEGLAEQRRWFKRWLALREARLLRKHEARVSSTFEAVTAVSDEDRQALLAIMPQPRDMTVIPIAVDCSSLRPLERRPDATAVLSLAAPHWPPNVAGIRWFTREVYPLVRRAVPESRFYICGPQPDQSVRALIEGDPSIAVTGFVDPTSYIERSACMIVPLQSSGGMRVMILEALARGIPVVATSVGIAGLDLQPGEHLLVADTPSDFADAVTLLLRDPELGARLAAAGRKIALERYDWHVVYTAIDQVYAKISQAKQQALAAEPAQAAPAIGDHSLQGRG